MAIFQNLPNIPGLCDQWDGFDGNEYLSTDDERDAILAHNNVVVRAQMRLQDKISAVIAQAMASSDAAEQAIIADLGQNLLIEENRTTPPAIVGLPHEIVHIALAARLLPAPAQSPALAPQAAGF